MEFLIGRSLANNITNLLLDPLVARGRASRRASTGSSVARAGAGRRPRQRRPRPARRVLHRLAGHAADPGHRLRPALRVRHLPAGRSRTAGRSSSPTTGCAGPTRGRSRGPHETRRGPARLLVRAARRRARASIPGQPSHAARHPVRPAGRRLRRQDDQHAAPVGGRRARLLRLPASSAAATSSARVAETLAAESLTRVLYPDDSTQPRPGAALPPGVLPRRLLAGRHRRAASARGNADWTRAARQGRHPAERHAPGDGRRRADAHPARRGAASAGTRPGT